MNRAASNSSFKKSLDALSVQSAAAESPFERRRVGKLVVLVLGVLGVLLLGRVVVYSEGGIQVSQLGDAVVWSSAQAKWGDVPCGGGDAAPPVDGSSRVLVTGAAGFIGHGPLRRHAALATACLPVPDVSRTRPWACPSSLLTGGGSALTDSTLLPQVSATA